MPDPKQNQFKGINFPNIPPLHAPPLDIPSIRVYQKSIDDLNKSVQDLTKAFESLSAQFKLVFDSHVLINGNFVDTKNIKGDQK